MGNVIYIDVLFALNIFINFFLLLATSGFVSIKPKKYRMLVSALAGSFLCLLILVDINPFISFVIKLAGMLAMLVIAYGFVRPALFIKTVIVFMAVNFVFAGIITAIWFLFSPAGMILKNGVVYFNVSPFLLFSVTVLSYLVLKVLELIASKRVEKERIYKIKIRIDDKSVELNALYDTGNNIVDAISGHPVTVCELDSIENILTYEDKVNISEFICKGSPPNSEIMGKRKLRLVPYHVINSSGIMVCIVPDDMWVEIDGEYKKIDSEIGITTHKLSQGEFQAVLNSKSLNKI